MYAHGNAKPGVPHPLGGGRTPFIMLSPKIPRRMFQRQPRSRAAALITVLSCLVFASLLVLVLFQLASSEQRSSAAFSESTQARNLAEIPVNMAIGQLRKATEQRGGQEGWASQPGMIRVYGVEPDPHPGAGGIRSTTMALYKLYSDNNMVVSKPGVSHNSNGLTLGEVQAAIDQDISDLAGWDQRPGLFVDLNEPVPVMDATDATPDFEFPIVDPRAMAANNDTGHAVDGFNFANNAIAGARVPASRNDPDARLPMPVRWLYVLKDGQIAADTRHEDGVIRFEGVVPSRDNPIVGRVAFWTDDETSKVNINTALEGVHWETPRTTSARDFQYGERMPARNEFSRYPGHPAQTSLSPVLQSFSPSFVINPGLDDATRAQRLENLHRISPRYPWGGTQGGTRVSPSAILEEKTDRLYASLDELLYDRERDLNDLGITGRDLAIGRFFLTTSSRANELGPMNKPKIMLWPLSRDVADRNAHDRLMTMLASSATGGTARSVGFYMERHNNALILTGRVGSGHTTWEDLRTRNDSVWGSYLHHFLGSPSQGQVQFIPGFKGWSQDSDRTSFASREKYGTGKRRQLMISMLDLLRWGVNTENVVEQDMPGGVTYKYLPPHNDMVENPSRRAESSSAPLVTFSNSNPNRRNDTNQIVSSYGSEINHATGNMGSWGVKGYGRFPTITEATLVFHRRTANSMRAFLVIEPFSPTNGPPAWTANYRYRVLFQGQENAPNRNASFQLTFANEGAGSNDDSDYLPMKFPRPHNPAGPQTATGGIPPQHPGNLTLNGLGTPNLPAENPYADYTLIRNTWPVSLVNYPVDMFADSTTQETGNTTPFAGLLTQFKQATTGHSPPPLTPLGKIPNPPQAWMSANWTRDNHTAHARFFPFYTRDEFLIPTDDDGNPLDRFHFTGGRITIALFLGWEGHDKHLPVQRIHMYFPPATFPVPTGDIGPFADRFRGSFTGAESGRAEDMRLNTIRPGDVTRSIEPNPAAPPKGDLRFHAAMENVPEEWFAPSPNYDNPEVQFTHGLRDGTWMQEAQLGGISTRETAGTLLQGVTYPDHAIPAVTRGVNGAVRIDGRPGDWDNGVGGIEDGPYVGKPDEGTGALPLGGYFNRGGQFASETGDTFSPNRMIASAVVFGSLPTGILQHFPFPETGDIMARWRAWPARQPSPWQNLLFNPIPHGRSTPASQEPGFDDHNGFLPPRDHLMLDLFRMPIVEPYAISDAFSTAGKINMNHQLLPFTHIERSTGLHAALKSTRVTAIPTSEVNRYKDPSGNNLEFRYSVNVEATLDGLNRRFNARDLYRSPSEICTIFLVPQRLPNASYGTAATPPSQYDDMVSWWNGSLNNQSDAMELTGNNTRESPYNCLYPRLTTQSNSYTVHYRVQTLRKSRSTDPAVWVEDTDLVTAEQRGSTLVERYLDPHEQEISNIGLGGNSFLQSWDDFYRFRVIHHRQFSR